MGGKEAMRLKLSTVLSRKNILMLGIVLLGVLAFSARYINAQDIEKAKQDRNNAQSNLATVQEQSKVIEEKRRVVNEEIVATSAEVSKLSDSIFELEKKEATKTQELEQTQVELEEAERVSKEQYLKMKKRIQYMYENGHFDVLETILSATDFSELLNRAEYINNLSSYDRQMLEEYEASLALVAEKKATLETEKAELTRLKDEANSQKTELEKKSQELTATVQQYAEEIAALQNQMAGYRQQVITASQVIESLLLEAQRKQEELAIAQRNEQAKATTSTPQQTQATTPTASQPVSQPEPVTTPAPVVTPAAPVEANTSDLNLLAAIIYCEAGGESHEGKVAVGNVILNRVRDPRFPNTISGVVYQSGQFEPVFTGRLQLALNSGVYTYCIGAAQDALNGARPVGDYLFFNSLPGQTGYRIGGHTFY